MVVVREVRRLILGMALLVLPASAAMATDCGDRRVSAIELQELIADAEAAFATQQAAPFRQAVEALDQWTPCMAEPISAPQAAALHRLHGLLAFLDKGFASSEQAFAASRRLQPSFEFQADLLPSTHPIRTRYRAMDVGDDQASVTIAPPKRGFVLLDGRMDGQRDPRLPVWFQRFDARGEVQQTSLWQPLSEGPSYQSGKPFPWLLTAGSVSLLGAGAAYGGAIGSKNAYNDAITSGDTQGQSKALRTNTTMVVASSTLFGAGVSLVAAHFFTRNR